MQEVQSRAVTPPPQPRELLSSTAALPSRARLRLSSLLPQNLFSRFRREKQSLPDTLHQTAQEMLRPKLDDSVMVQLTKAEFDKTTSSLPQEEIFTDQSLEILVAAMANNVKDARLRELVPDGITTTRISEVEELHTLDPVVDAYSKAKDAARIADTRDDLRRPVRKGQLVTVGVDVITEIPVQENGEMGYKPFGKPQTEGEVYNMFVAMNGIMQKGNLSAYPYMTKVATVIHNPYYPNRDAFTVQQAAVLLSPELVASLATPEGFAEYKSIAEESLNKLHQPEGNRKTILDTAGGFVIEGFRGMLAGNGIKTIIAHSTDVSPQTFTSGVFNEQAYAEAKQIARGHADEQLIADYTARFPQAANQNIISPVS